MNNQPQPSVQVLRIINIAMMFTHVILIFMLFMMFKDRDSFFQFKLLEGNQEIVMIFGLVSAIQVMMVLFVPKLIKRPALPKQELLPADFLNPNQGPASSLFFDFSIFDQYVFSTTIVRLALAESVGIFGFVIAMLNQSLVLMLPFTVVALIMQFIVGPFYRRSQGA